jgi:hypothetical protein
LQHVGVWQVNLLATRIGQIRGELENAGSGVSSSEQKIDGLSNSGQQKKSTLPLSLTSAALRMSPMMPWASMGLCRSG